jgi:hypothetical protein
MMQQGKKEDKSRQQIRKGKMDEAGARRSNESKYGQPKEQSIKQSVSLSGFHGG